jgi:hypothetical protein
VIAPGAVADAFLVGSGRGASLSLSNCCLECVEKLCSLQSKDEYDEEARKRLIRLVGIDSPEWVSKVTNHSVS